MVAAAAAEGGEVAGVSGDVLAAGLSLATLLWTLVSFFLTRGRLSRFEARSLAESMEIANREQHRRELNDGIGYVLARDTKSRAIGLIMLEQLARASWVTDDDRAKVTAVMRTVTGE